MILQIKIKIKQNIQQLPQDIPKKINDCSWKIPQKRYVHIFVGMFAVLKVGMRCPDNGPNNGPRNVTII